MAPIRQILLFSDGYSRKGQFPTSGIYLWTVLTEVHRRIIGKDCKIHFQWLFRVQEDISSVLWFQLVLRKSCHLKCHEGWVMSDEKMATSHPCSELCWLGNGTCVQNHWGLDLWRATEAVATEFWDSDSALHHLFSLCLPWHLSHCTAGQPWELNWQKIIHCA